MTHKAWFFLFLALFVFDSIVRFFGGASGPVWPLVDNTLDWASGGLLAYSWLAWRASK